MANHIGEFEAHCLLEFALEFTTIENRERGQWLCCPQFRTNVHI